MKGGDKCVVYNQPINLWEWKCCQINIFIISVRGHWQTKETHKGSKICQWSISWYLCEHCLCPETGIGTNKILLASCFTATCL